MKIIIIGAGELGLLVASKLIALNHNVALIDLDVQLLEAASDALDGLLLEGAGTDPETLKKAGAESADCILALTGDEATNILACTIAKKLGTKSAICRIYSEHIFSDGSGITPDFFNIDKYFSSADEILTLIQGILPSRILQETITFPNPNARINVINVPVNSILLDAKIRDFPFQDRLKNVRLAAIIRNGELIVPHGDTMLQPGDRVYISGHKEEVDRFSDWLSNDADSPVKRVVVAGISPVGERLISYLVENGFDVRVIEPNMKKAEHLLSGLSDSTILLNGEITNAEILEEADVAGCDAFAALSDKDENNVLSCLLASRLGARKVIALTGKAEYMDILPDIQRAGCWFNITQIAANTVFRLMSKDTVRVDPQLRALNAKLVELTLSAKSKYIGVPLQECDLPDNFLIAIVQRGQEVIAPTGQTVLHPGDVIIAIANTKAILKMKRHL